MYQEFPPTEDYAFVMTGCGIYYVNGNPITQPKLPLTGYSSVFINSAVWSVNSSTGIVIAYDQQC